LPFAVSFSVAGHAGVRPAAHSLSRISGSARYVGKFVAQNRSDLGARFGTSAAYADCVHWLVQCPCSSQRGRSWLRPSAQQPVLLKPAQRRVEADGDASGSAGALYVGDELQLRVARATARRFKLKSK
jgi:hypothetical protein